MIEYDDGSLIDYINSKITENVVPKQKINSLCCTECTDFAIMIMFLFTLSRFKNMKIKTC